MPNPLIVSVDIETTGLDPETCQTVEVAAVAERVGSKDPVESLPWFHCYVSCPLYTGQPAALAMHSRVFDAIHRAKFNEWAPGPGEGQILRPNDVAIELSGWLERVGAEKAKKGNAVEVQCAGKNFAGFDLQFLKKLPDWSRYVRVAHRVFDPAILFFDPATDDKIPDTAECLRRAGLKPSGSHRALDDARDVVRILRHAWRSR